MWLIWVLVAILLLLLIALFWPVRLQAFIRLENEPIVYIALCLIIFSGLFKPQVQFVCNPLQRNQFLLLRRKSKEPRVVWSPGKKRTQEHASFPIRSVWRHVRLYKVAIHGSLGIANDACKTALLSGALAALFQSLCAALSFEKQADYHVEILPTFNKNLFRLNLEGIAATAPVHIIIAILNYGIQSRKGKKRHGASHREHYENHYGGIA